MMEVVYAKQVNSRCVYVCVCVCVCGEQREGILSSHGSLYALVFSKNQCVLGEVKGSRGKGNGV